jgi:hypothetical protein
VVVIFGNSCTIPAHNSCIFPAFTPAFKWDAGVNAGMKLEKQEKL